VRQTTFERQQVLITMTKQLPGLNERLQSINAGLEQVISRRVSDTLFVLELPSATLPDVLSERLALLLRDYAYETIEGVRSRSLVVQREVPTTVTLTSMEAPPPQQPGPVGGTPPAAPPPGAQGVEPVAHNPLVEADKIRRAVPATIESRLRPLAAQSPN